MVHDFLELHRIKHSRTSILIKLKDLNSILFNEVINNNFFMNPITNRKNCNSIENTNMALTENHKNISEAIGIVLTDICLSPDFNPQRTTKITSNFTDLKLWEFLIHEAGLDCLKIGRMSDLSQKSPDLYVYYSAFKNFGPPPKFGHFWSFLSACPSFSFFVGNFENFNYLAKKLF